jgi:hypothetical protein
MARLEGERNRFDLGRRNDRMQRQIDAEAVRGIAREAMAQWQRAITGVMALPAALALGWASSAMYVALFLERGFEVFQLSTRSFLSEMGEEAERANGEKRIGEESRRPEQPRA